MFSKMIDNYIKNLTKDDILNYSIKEKINLNFNELECIYNTIKNDYKTLLYGDYNTIFNNIKSRINPTSYRKIKTLFIKYKNKYNKYL